MKQEERIYLDEKIGSLKINSVKKEFNIIQHILLKSVAGYTFSYYMKIKSKILRELQMLYVDFYP